MIRTDDDILETEPTPLTPMQATEAVKAIRDFVITLEIQANQRDNFFPIFWPWKTRVSLENFQSCANCSRTLLHD